MRCSKCDTELSENTKFCTKCGTKVGDVVPSETSIGEKVKKLTLSQWALGFLIIKGIIFLSFFSGIIKNDAILAFPGIVISLVLAIISRCRHKDKMSLFLIVIDSILIFIEIAVIVVYVLLLGLLLRAGVSIFEQIIQGCSGFPW